MKFFKDEKLTQEVTEFDLGIVPAGTTKTFTFYMLNDEAPLINLRFDIDNKEVKIIDFPKELDTNESSKLILSWTPSVTLKKGLKAQISITGEQLYK